MTSSVPLKVAYFSMEFALDPAIPNYAGGLGVLAADIMHSFADMQYPAVGVSLIYHQDDDAQYAFDAEKYMQPLPETITVRIEDRDVRVGVFQYDVKGREGNSVPIYFLTTNLPENEKWDRDLTKHLYASDQYTRIGQEAILGIGGLRMLRKLGYDHIDHLHMNEGHSAFLTLESLKEQNYRDQQVRAQCTFTTHTPVKAGHDHFEYPLVRKMLGDMIPWHMHRLATEQNCSMTHLALNLSKKTNSVSARHREVCADMFPGYQFENVTNGIHHLTWASDAMSKLFTTQFPKWKQNPDLLLQAHSLNDADVVSAHKHNKKHLIDWINSNDEFFHYWEGMCDEDYFDEKTLTIAFARRFVPYKRPGLIFRNVDQLRKLGYRKIQIIFAGKCHPDDQFCNWKKDDLRRYAQRLRGQIRVAVIPDYNVHIAKKLVSGSDIWLNNPIPPREASGTSGMKAALNGVLNLSVLDGWWIEGLQMQPLAGWGFGQHSHRFDEHTRDDVDADNLYRSLEDAIECYYHHPKKWTQRMKSAISLAGYFHTERVVKEYEERMWSACANS